MPFLLFLLLLLGACVRPSPQPQPPVNPSHTWRDSLQTLPVRQTLPLYVSTEEASLRRSPQFESPIVRRLQKGDSLLFGGQITQATFALEMQGLPYDEPFIQVFLPQDSTELWVYGGCLRFREQDQALLAPLTLERRLTRCFGPSLAAKLQHHQENWNQTQTSIAFELCWRQALNLRDSLETHMNRYLSQNQDSLPDFFWLNEIAPGFLVHYLRDAKEYRLFRDFRQWDQLAKQSPEAEDDSLCALYFQVFATDSIEYLRPDWLLPCGPDDSLLCSTLGRGLHATLFAQMQALQQRDNRFEQALQTLRRELLHDALNQTHFWEPRQAVRQELQALSKMQGPFLLPSDRVALKERLRRLDSLPAADFNYLEQNF